MPDDREERLREFMGKYLGRMGDFLLKKEMSILDIYDLEEIDTDDDIKDRLIDRIINDCLSTIMSPSRIRMARAELASILNTDIHLIEGAIRK